MRKQVLFFVMLFAVNFIQAQTSKSLNADKGTVWYEQNFENFSDGDMLFIDNDKLTVADYIIEQYGDFPSWKIREGEAISTSVIVDGNQTADNWMITPKITIGQGAFLVWNAHSLFQNDLDGYEVLISTTDPLLNSFTRVLSVPTENFVNTVRFLDLEALGYTNKAIYVAFRHNSTDAYIIGIDNISVKQLSGLDAKLLSTNLPSLVVRNNTFNLQGKLQNMSLEKITSFDVSYKINNGTVQTYTVNNQNASLFDTISFAHNIPMSFPDAGLCKVSVWISNINGRNDDNQQNDTLSANIQSFYYYQDFENFNAGDMKFIDRDGLTPAQQVISQFGDFRSWKVYWSIDYGWENWAISTSWLVDGDKTADDWMITPKINVGKSAFLTWNAVAFPGNNDGYEVLVSTDTVLSNFKVVFTMPAEQNTPVEHAVNLEKSGYADQDVYIAFRNHSTDRNVLGIDDIIVKKIEGFDLQLVSTNVPMLMMNNNDFTLSGKIKSFGGEDITSFDVNYRINDGDVKTSSFTNQSISYLEEKEFSHTIPLRFDTTDMYKVTVWLSNVNGVNDGNATNDTLTAWVSTLDKNANRKVLAEEFTGTWCGWCPDGSMWNDTLNNHDKIIAVSLHWDDFMEIYSNRRLQIAYHAKFPGAIIDRAQPTSISDRPQWLVEGKKRVQALGPVEMSVNRTYNPQTKELKISITAEFLTTMKGDFRFNCYVVQNEVVGQGFGYDQKNYYSGLSGYETHPYYNQPNLIVGFKHLRVVSAALGDEWGTAGIIPSQVKKGDKYTHEYTYSLEWYDPMNITLVPFISMYDPNDVSKCQVLNADEKPALDLSLVVKKDNNLLPSGTAINVTGGTNDTEVLLPLNVTNYSQAPIKVIVKKTIMNELAGTESYFCWGVTCYTPETIVSTDTVLIAPGFVNNSFKSYLKPKGIAGNTKIRYSFKNVDNTNDFTDIDLNYSIVKRYSFQFVRNSNVVDLGSTVTISGTTDDSELTANMNIVNKSSNKIRVLVKKTVVSKVAEANAYFAWGQSSYTPTVEVSTDTVSIDAGATNSTFKAMLQPNGKKGESVVKYHFMNIDNAADTANVTFKYVVSSGTAVPKSLENNGINVYPNPVTANSVLTIQLPPHHNDAQMRVVSTTGQIVYKQSINSSVTHVGNLYNLLQAGVYWLYIENNNYTAHTRLVVVK